VLVLSAGLVPRMQEMKNAENVIEILAKPIKGSVLVDAVNGIIARQQVHQKNRQRIVERLGPHLHKH